MRSRPLLAPQVSRWVVGPAGLLLPASCRDSWAASWSSNLAAMRTRKGRARYCWNLILGLPKLTFELRRSPRAPS